MCGDDGSSFRTDRAVLIGLSVSIILVILVIAIVIVTVSFLRRKKRDERFQVQLDSKEDTAHFLHDSNIESDDLECDFNM